MEDNVTIDEIKKSGGEAILVNIPTALVIIAAFITSSLEFIGGLLLCLGLFKYVVLYLHV